MEPLGFPPGRQTLELFRNHPSELICILCDWWYEAVQATRATEVEDGLPQPARGFFTTTHHLVYWCDAELRTIDAAPLLRIHDQIWARVTKYHCHCGGTGINGKCNRCGSTEGRSPNWATYADMDRSLSAAQTVKERIEIIANAAYREERERGKAAYPNHDRDKCIYELRHDGKTWKEIGMILKQHPEWESIENSAIRKAAATYARRCNRPPLTRGKSGRPAAK